MAGLAFNDTSGGQGLIQDCEDLLNLGATGISSNTNLLKTFTRYINTNYHKVVTTILQASDDWDFDDSNNTDYPTGTFVGTTNRDYTFPASMKILKIKRVDLTRDGTNYYKAEPLDSQMISDGLGDDTSTDARFSKTEPYYDIKANSIWIYPKFTAAEVTAGAKVRLEFYRDIVEFTTASTTATPGIDAPFHRMLSIGAALDYAIIRNLDAKNDLMALYTDFEKHLITYYGKKNTDTNYQLKAGFVNYE